MADDLFSNNKRDLSQLIYQLDRLYIDDRRISVPADLRASQGFRTACLALMSKIKKDGSDVSVLKEQILSVRSFLEKYITA